MEVFVFPEKINVFQHDSDWERCRPLGPKNVHNFLMTAENELSMRSCRWNVSDFNYLFSTWTQQTRDVHPMLFQCWLTVFDAGPTLKQHRVNASCLLGIIKAKSCDLASIIQVEDITVQRNVPRFCMSVICGWNLQFPILFQPRWV